MAPGPYSKTIEKSTQGDRLCLLEGGHRLPRLSPYNSTPDHHEQQQDVTKTLLLSGPQDDATSSEDHDDHHHHDHHTTTIDDHDHDHHTTTTEDHDHYHHHHDHHTTSLLPSKEEEREEEEEDEGKRGLVAKEGSRGDDSEEGGRGKEKEGREKKGGKDGPVRRERDLVAFWLLGFCNNFTYWVMITAAYDLLSIQAQTHIERSQQSPPPPTLYSNNTEVIAQLTTGTTSTWANDSTTNIENTFKCLRHSTGAILIADTLPATALTLAAPLTLLVGVWARVWVLSALCVASYLILGLATPSLVFLGVALASASRGFSDTTFLAYASHYHKHVLSLWSSGTGVATFVGPLLYSLMTSVGFDPRHVLLVFLTIPVLIIVSFSCILSHKKTGSSPKDVEGQQLATKASEHDLKSKNQKTAALTKKKFYLFLRVQKYLLPLAVFYHIMYFTNQGLLELVYFPGSQLSHAQQYSWSNTVRCLGTLISRSSHKILLLPSAWPYTLPVVAILLVVGTEAHYHYLPSEYIIFTLLFLQGIMEGAAFRATVFNIHNMASEEKRAFCLGIFPSSLFLPAMLAGFASIPTHDFLCKHHLYRQ